MSGFWASCPGCGAEVQFVTPGSAAVTCATCRTLVARADAANLGKIADVQGGDTPLSEGVGGVYEGAPFTLVGATRLKAGDAEWEEWYAYFPNDHRWGWLSYSQGRYHMYFEASQANLPKVAQLQHDSPWTVGDGSYRLAERGDAHYIAASGELPFVPHPSRRWAYADLRGTGGRVATLSEYDGSTLFLGARTTLLAMNMQALPRARARRSVAVKNVTCPSCSAALTLHAGNLTVNVVCSFCGSLFNAQQEPLRSLRQTRAPKVRPTLALGSVGELEGTQFRIVGFMVRETGPEDDKFAWHEYLLYEAARGFAWLVHSDGQWTFVETADDVSLSLDGRTAYFGGMAYPKHERCVARVSYVLGEFYWAVAVGEQVQVTDYLAPPSSLSREQNGDEVIWSAGSYLRKYDVIRAFSPGENIAAPNNAAAWQHEGWFAAPCVLSVLALVLYFVLDAGRSVAAVEAFFELKRDEAVLMEPFNITTERAVGVRVESLGGAVALDGTWQTLTDQGQPNLAFAPVHFAMDIEHNDSDTLYLSGRPPSRGQIRFLVRDVDAFAKGIRVTVYENACDSDWVVVTWIVCAAWTFIMFLKQLGAQGSWASHAND